MTDNEGDKELMPLFCPIVTLPTKLWYDTLFNHSGHEYPKLNTVQELN